MVEQEYRIGEVLFSRGEIAERVSGLADRIAADMRGKKLAYKRPTQLATLPESF